MKNFLDKKISVRSLLVLLLVVVAATVAIAATATQIVATLSPDITIRYGGVIQTPRDYSGNVMYPVTYGGRTYLPLLAISDILGVSLNWDQATKTVTIGSGSGGSTTPPPPTPVPSPSPSPSPGVGSGTIPSAGGQVTVSRETNFTFTPNQSGVWVFRTLNNGNSDPYLTIFDSRGAWVAEDDDSGGGNNALISVILNAGTTYTVKAGFYGAGSGSYTLAVSAAPALPTNGGDVRATSETNYTFTPNRTGIWQFRTSDNGSSDPELAIFNSNDENLNYDFDAAGNLNALMVMPLHAGETYRVYLWFYGGTGNCTLTVSQITPVTIPANGDSLRVSTVSAYSFTPAQSGTWEFRTSNNGNCDPFLWLYDSNYRLITTDDDGGDELNARISHSLTAGETYYVIADYFESDGSGSYTLTVSRR